MSKDSIRKQSSQEMVTTLLNLTGIESHNSAPADEKVAKYLLFHMIESSPNIPRTLPNIPTARTPLAGGLGRGQGAEQPAPPKPCGADLLHNKRIPFETLVKDQEPLHPWHSRAPDQGDLQVFVACD